MVTRAERLAEFSTGAPPNWRADGIGFAKITRGRTRYLIRAVGQRARGTTRIPARSLTRVVGWRRYGGWSTTLVAILVDIDKSPLHFSGGDIMAKRKKIVRRAWTKEDRRTLAKLAKSKIGVRKIARQLKRTPGATTVMASKLGVSLSTYS